MEDIMHTGLVVKNKRLSNLFLLHWAYFRLLHKYASVGNKMFLLNLFFLSFILSLFFPQNENSFFKVGNQLLYKRAKVYGAHRRSTTEPTEMLWIWTSFKVKCHSQKKCNIWVALQANKPSWKILQLFSFPT